MEEQQTGKRKWLIIGGGILLALIVIIGAFFFYSKKSSDGGVKSLTSLFGLSGPEVKRPSSGVILPNDTQNSTNNEDDTIQEEPLFRQLANFPIAGATSVTRGGETYVRYTAKENAFTYETNPKTGETTTLTNTTIPRIYEALWGNNGNSVVLRYLDTGNQDIIKTFLANIIPSKEENASTTEGKLVGDFLPDNISQVSISPDGKKIFYLLPVAEGISGTIVDIKTKGAKEVLRSPFSEWLPQLLNNGTILLTTKSSGKISGFSYIYNPTDKSFSRILRQINGLTTLSEQKGVRILYNEGTKLNIYDQNGYTGDEGVINHSIEIPIATLPEKCVWAKNSMRLFCGAYVSTPSALIPDEWYQGTLTFADTFWTINTDTSEINFLADPTKELTAKRSFDVYQPFIGGNEDYFLFINKEDNTLWSMRIKKEKYMTIEEQVNQENTTVLTPDELKDVVQSKPTTKP